MFNIFGRKSEISVQCILKPTFLEISFFVKSTNERLNLPLDKAARKNLSERVPKKAVAFSMIESFLSNLVSDFEPDIDFGRNLGFDDSQLNQQPIHFENGSLRLSYPFVYMVTFGEQENAFGLSPRHLRELGIPKYHTFRIEVVPKSVPKLSDFRISYTLKTESRELIELKTLNGSILTDTSDVEYLVLPSQAALIRRLEEHRSTCKADEYLKNESIRLKELAKIKEHAEHAKASLHRAIRDQNIIILEDMDYEIGRGIDDEVVIRPVMPNEHLQLDSQLQDGVAALNATPDGSALNLTGQEGKKIRVVLSNNAKERLKKINEIRSSSQEFLETVIANPEKYIGTAPRVPIDNLFSRRVGHLIFGKGKASRDGDASGTGWADGFEGNSVFWSDTKGKTYREQTNPTPDVYEKMKIALDQEEQRCRCEGIRLDKDAHLQIEGIENPVSVHTVTEICRRVESVTRLNLESEEQIHLAKNLIEDAKQKGSVLIEWTTGDKTIKIPRAALEKSIPQEKEQTPRPESVTLGSKSFENEIGSTQESKYEWSWQQPIINPELASPPAFRADITLQDHQKIGASWLHFLSVFGPAHESFGRGAIVADDMGVGKTIQVLAYISHAMQGLGDSNESILIVAPLNLINNSWIKDGFVKFFKQASVNIYGLGGGPRVVRFDECPIKVNKQKLNAEARRWQEQMEKEGKSLAECDIAKDVKEPLDLIRQWMAGKIVLCSYETLRINSLVLGSVDFRVVVLDEAQKIKNENALQASAAKALKSKMNIAMSGTPIENSIIDLWNLVDFALPGKLGSKAEFRDKFHKPLKEAPQGSAERMDLRKSLESMLFPIWLRRTKAEIYATGKGLPEIIHYDSIKAGDGVRNEHLVPMSEEQFVFYSDAVAYLKQVKGGERLAAIQKMLQLCLAPWLYTGTETLWSNRDFLFRLCPKLKALMDILEKIRTNSDDEGQKCLIFVNLIDVQMSLATFIRDWHVQVAGSDLDVHIFNGEVKPGDRDERLRKFKENPGFQVLIISPRSGGVGLNLQEANHVIHYSREWNPAVERQATDRVYRIGQTRQVHVYYPITSLHQRNLLCAEEHLAEILRRKREVVDDFTLSTEDLSVNTADFAKSESNMEEKDIEIRLEDVSTLDPIDFELLIAILFERKGYETKWVGQSKDRGADVLAFKPGENLLIQAKHTKVRRPITEVAVGDPRRAKSTYEMKYNTIFKLAVVTNHRFSEGCYPYAQEGAEVFLWDIDWLAEEMKSTRILLSDLKARRTSK